MRRLKNSINFKIQKCITYRAVLPSIFHAYQPESVLNYVELRTDCLLSNLMTIIVSFLLFSHKKYCMVPKKTQNINAGKTTKKLNKQNPKKIL